MKKNFIYLLLLFSLISHAQITPSYPTIKLTKTIEGVKHDSLLVVATDKTVKHIPFSKITSVLEYTTASALPITGVAGKIYVTKDNGKIYRWNGTYYTELAITDISGKVDKVTGKSLLSDTEITRLATLSNYTHPTNHPPSIITQDLNNRFVTDAEKSDWNNKQIALGFTPENVANKNTANGYAGLGSDGKLISSQLPSITISDTFVTASQAAMLALTAETGDVAVRTDLNKSYILKENNPTVLASWQELLTPTSEVTSVNGRTGAVVVTKADVSLNNADNTSDINKPISTATQTALNGKENSFTKNTAFNKNFGTTAGTVVEGNYPPAKDGTGAMGTWGINISGNAANSTLWNGINYDGAFQDQPISYILSRDGFSDTYKRTSDANIKSWLGLGSNAYTSTDYFKYETFTADANALLGNRSAFTYAINAPHVGPIAHFDANGYGMQMNMSYGNNGNAISLRSKNEDKSFWNPWKNLWHDGNFNPANYLPLSGAVTEGSFHFKGETKFGFPYVDPEHGTERAIKIGANGIAVLGGIKTDLLVSTGTITASPATLPNHVVVKSQLDAVATSGSYTPSLSDFANTSARNLVKATYSKIGGIVTVFIHLTVDVITANTDTVVTVSLPINKVNTSLYELGVGVGRLSSVNTNEFTVRISNVTSTNNIIRLVFKPVSSGTNIVSASFSYAIN